MISGRVLRPYIITSRDPDRRYRPVGNARVVARSGGNIVATTFSGVRGDYAFEPLPLGSFEITALRAGWEPVPQVGSKEITVTPEHLLWHTDLFPEGRVYQS